MAVRCTLYMVERGVSHGQVEKRCRRTEEGHRSAMNARAKGSEPSCYRVDESLPIPLC